MPSASFTLPPQLFMYRLMVSPACASFVFSTKYRWHVVLSTASQEYVSQLNRSPSGFMSSVM